MTHSATTRFRIQLQNVQVMATTGSRVSDALQQSRALNQQDQAVSSSLSFVFLHTQNLLLLGIKLFQELTMRSPALIRLVTTSLWNWQKRFCNAAQK